MLFRSLHVWRECDGWVCLTGQLDTPQSEAQKKTLKTAESAITHPRKSRVLGVACLVFLSLLVLAELFYLTRHGLGLQLAKLPPTLQEPGLRAFKKIDAWLCQQLPCEDIALRDFSAWAIELANLKINPPTKAGAEVTGILELQIRNKLDAHVAWPHVLLSITDANDAVVTEKLLTPKDWLPEDDSSIDIKGSKGPSEVSSNVFMNLPNTAAGFRVRLLYVSDKTPPINIEDSKESLVQPTPSPTKE